MEMAPVDEAVVAAAGLRGGAGGLADRTKATKSPTFSPQSNSKSSVSTIKVSVDLILPSWQTSCHGGAMSNAENADTNCVGNNCVDVCSSTAR